MLRPERMSKVSVTGAKRVIDDVIEAAYEQRALHVSDYDDSWEGFDPGESMAGAEGVNERLVTVRALESTLDVDEADVEEGYDLDDEALEAELAELRDRVNDLDDRRSELRGEIREIDEEIDRMAPFADLGIDLDLLSGYDSLAVVVVEGRAAPVEAALAGSEAIDAFEVFSGDDTVAAFARPAATADEDALSDALVGVDVTMLEVPDAEGGPEDYVGRLRDQRRDLEAQLDDVEDELDAIRRERASFLLAAEEQLTVEAQKRQAPLSFATTRNAFVAEGWIPTEQFGAFADAITDAAGDHVEIEELERASFTAHGDHETEPTDAGAGPAATDAEREAAADGGHEQPVTIDDEPPVVQDNPEVVSPFETLVKAVNRPKYHEFDPTIILFLTFPLMFGFMIGDIGYGVLYVAMGYYLYENFDSPAMTNVGAVAMWAGGFTALFGLLYGGDVFGHAMLGFHPLYKGISPGETHWALAWLVFAVLFGLFHLNVGYLLSFFEELQLHGFEEAAYESGSWILLLNGFWLWAFSRHVQDPKPEFMFEAFEVVLGLEFGGLPVVVGYLGLAAVVLGVVLLAKGAPTEIAEVLSPLVNALSYTRITAVLLAKAGMAIAANLLAFGAYIDHGHFEFIFTSEHLAELEAEGANIIFPGLTTSPEYPILGLIAGIVVAVVGHVVVLLLGITAAGIQGIRLEYVEFFGQFYEGGGRAYDPLGYDRRFTDGD